MLLYLHAIVFISHNVLRVVVYLHCNVFFYKGRKKQM